MMSSYSVTCKYTPAKELHIKTAPMTIDRIPIDDLRIGGVDGARDVEQRRA